uniref:Uncharacterized protein n=1 Tax=uncultured marine group II/III euryarchaeote KM3_53_G07 TaxID=1456458 RepID=A0A075H644_9EURY|nr:hypothetical protein [uncultured marine group II/III euryarchaeote KM3_53_G07]
MAAAERGSFMWGIVSITQLFLAVKLMDDFDGWLTTLIGASGAACVMVAIVLFRQEQRDLLINPMKKIQKEVHADQISKQGKGVWIGVVMWAAAMIFGAIAL